MTAPLDVPESTTQTLAPVAGPGVVEGRSLWQIAWMRLKRDKVAIAGGFVVILLILVAIFAPLIVELARAPAAIPPGPDRPDLQAPYGGFGGHQRGPPAGRRAGQRPRHLQPGRLRRPDLPADRVPRHAAVGRIGTVLGVIAGYFGGWVDTLISRTMDMFLAFPLLLFAIALAGVVPDKAFGLQRRRAADRADLFIIGFFNWPYIGRIIRGQTLSLREREFVDAARSLGARSPSSCSRSCCRT